MRTRTLLSAVALPVAIALISLSCSSAGVAEDAISYNREVAPILAAHCYECHGPDAEQREAGLRLDLESNAKQSLESGAAAIVPGNSTESELIRRLVSKNDDRMPPLDHGKALSDRQIQVLQNWIDAGATWQGHWAFEPLQTDSPPIVKDHAWPSNPIDMFVLAKLESTEIEPSRPATRAALIRRVYFDLVGLPPSAADVRGFINSQHPNAYEEIVDRLLGSPQYGERWGRHWLDVARYADSNGGDENHAYPLAHRYRDYVIEAVNEDMTYDRFIRQQLAGDLLETTTDDRLNKQRKTATGYLAIGMKILAEQDPVKKQADMVDEQIDTFGRTFLGLSLGCARCHDHKFDPIPTRDYYALAGVFHSSVVADQPLITRDYRQQVDVFNRNKQSIQEEIDSLELQLNSASSTSALVREAESFDRGNVVIDNENYGQGIGIISDPGGQKNFVEYDFKLPQAGRFVVQMRYAAQNARPGRILVNRELVIEDAIARTTGGWSPDQQQWFTEGVVQFAAGNNVLRIESEPMMSHIDKWRMIDTKQVSLALIEKLDQATASLAKLESNEPRPTMVMGISDDKTTKNVKVHLRGSHLDLGAEVQRSFLEVLDGKSRMVPDSTSGRRELATWLTENPVAARLTSRVIVNRLWHWHFGRGLVTTPDDFGIRGEPPTHPGLLDFLARQLIEHDWSLKSIHRLIVTSQTFKMSAHNATQDSNPEAMKVDPGNRLYWKRDRTRLSAESIRDALLFHADELIQAFGDAPMNVKSQDPSPEDMQQNLDKYDGSRRRSVYLPVVRSNVYEFLTLFDFPNASTPVGRRNMTTIPTQALWLMNSPFMVRHAKRIATGIAHQATEPSLAAKAIRELYLRLFAREATDAEVEAGQHFLQRCIDTADSNSEIVETSLTQASTGSRVIAWTMYCQVLLSSNEYLYLN